MTEKTQTAPFRRLSPEELLQAKRLSSEEIRAAWRQGRAERDQAVAASRPLISVDPKLRF